MATSANSKKPDRRPYPHEVLPTEYHDDNEPMSGTASNVNKAPQVQKDGYQDDVILDWDAICSRLALEGYRLNYDSSIQYIGTPDLPIGVEMVKKQLLLRDKAYAGVERRRALIGTLVSDALNDYQKKITKCLYHPSYSSLELRQLGAYVQSWQIPEHEYSDRNWRGSGNQSFYTHIPKKMIPSHEQFTDAVKELKFGDIFTIFKGAALEQIKLFIGRVVLGPQGTIDPETDEKLVHTYRNIVVVDGAYAGQGKTSLFGMLAHALERVGYDVNQACPSLAGRFNHKAAFVSDFILTDDITSEHLKAELSSPNAKIMATGGWLATEEKGENAVPTKCKTALLVLANRCKQSLLWGMDDGMRSRITLCGTEPEGSIPENQLPQYHLPKLAEKLNVDVDTLFLWACRLAADEFAKYTNKDAFKLEARIKELQDLSDSNSSDPLDGAIAAVVLGYMLEKGEAPPKQLNKDVLAIGLKGMLNVKQAPDVAKLLGDPNRIPGWSPGIGMKWINPASILTAHHVLTSGGISTSPNKLIKNAFEALSLRDGNQCYGSPGVVLPRWTSLVGNEFTLNRIKVLCDTMISSYASVRGRMGTDIQFSEDLFWNS